MTFTAYRRQIRLCASAARLVAGSSVTSTAMDLGFGSASNFINAFRSATGLTPGNYLKKVGSGAPGGR
jgi:AraC-like DNA-binding protein